MEKTLLMTIILIFGLNVNAATIHYYNNNTSNSSNTKQVSNTDSEYIADLNMVERGIFGRIYASDNVKTRLSRIERRMFNRVYPSMSISQRMNNVLTNYENGTAYNGTSLKDRLINTIVGQPTGYTPPIYPVYSPYQRINPSYMQRAYGTNGWRYTDYSYPMSRAGIHILD